MKNLLCITAVLLLGSSFVFSQNFRIGFQSGANISNVQYLKNTYNQWLPKVGTSNGLSAEYRFSDAFALTGGLDFLSLYYESVVQNYDYFFGYIGSETQWYPGWYPIPDQLIHNHNILRIPLKAKYSIGNQPQIYTSIGAYYSRVYDRKRKLAEEKASDIGILLTHGMEYKLNEHFDLSLELRYTHGFTDTVMSTYSHAGSEILFGIGYTFGGNSFLSTKSGNEPKPEQSKLHYKAGLIFSALKGDEKDLYKPGAGLSAGFSYKNDWGNGFHFETGIMFQRKSYAINDSSIQFNIVNQERSFRYLVDTQTSIDYLNAPFILTLAGYNPFRFYCGVGVYAGLKIDANTHGKAYYTEETESSKYDIIYNVNQKTGNFYKTGDFGFIAQAGFQIPINEKIKLRFNSVYERSFLNIVKYEDSNQVVSLHSLAVHAGIVVPF